MSGKPRKDRLRRQYERERQWAEQLLAAGKTKRLRLYAEINDAFYRERELPEAAEESDPDIGLQAQLLAPYISSSSVVFEFGSGTGGVARRLSPLVKRYIAVEASAQVSQTVEFPATAELIISSDLRFDLPDDSVDLAFSCHVVEHLHPDDARSLAGEMFRLLKPGGRLIWVTPNRLLGPHDISCGFSARASGLHLREYTYGELADVINGAGFNGIRALAGIGQPPRERNLGAYRLAEGILERLPIQLRRSLLSLGFRRPPFRWLEQVALTAINFTAGPGGLVEPFLHPERNRVYNPITDLALEDGDEDLPTVLALSSKRRRVIDLDEGLRKRLRGDGWIVAGDDHLSTRHRLIFVSLETTSVCNQACTFCPVSVAPRSAEVMSRQLFETIADQLQNFSDTLQAVFLHNYNEPTADPHLTERVQVLKERGLPVAINSNGSGLTKSRVDSLVDLGGIGFLSINLSTLDSSRYKAERGADHLARVLANLDYAGGLPLAEIMEVAVLGHGGPDHRAELDRIRERLAATRFVVKSFLINHRAGALQTGLKPDRPNVRLRGCDSMGSRPLQHLHITATGACVLCCQDYHERHVVGDLSKHTLLQVLEGPELSQLRRFIYGLDEAPADLLCRNCVYARS